MVVRAAVLGSLIWIVSSLVRLACSPSEFSLHCPSASSAAQSPSCCIGITWKCSRNDCNSTCTPSQCYGLGKSMATVTQVPVATPIQNSDVSDSYLMSQLHYGMRQVGGSALFELTWGSHTFYKLGTFY